jgi:Integrase core domain
LPEIEGGRPSKKRFKAYPIGYFHVDIAEVQTAKGKLYVYVAIDRTSKFAFVQLVRKTGRTSAETFLEALIAAVPYKIHTVLTDNGIQFTFPPRYADGPTQDTRHICSICASADQDQASLDQWSGKAHELHDQGRDPANAAPSLGLRLPGFPLANAIRGRW